MKKKFICGVCGYEHIGIAPPEICPQCREAKENFKEVENDTDLDSDEE